MLFEIFNSLENRAKSSMKVSELQSKTVLPRVQRQIVYQSLCCFAEEHGEDIAPYLCERSSPESSDFDGLPPEPDASLAWECKAEALVRTEDNRDVYKNVQEHTAALSESLQQSGTDQRLLHRSQLVFSIIHKISSFDTSFQLNILRQKSRKICKIIPPTVLELLMRDFS
ncbi:Hypothetical predicted protein [Scomber scombrus]|uniref:Uncharacterized protein n=1 Tax=Scomber scombrus TaxID=13677 RepID=A0AAV1NJA4_SCOSC